MIVTDQLDRKVRIPEKLERIVSLVPSQTELLVDLGLREKLVGITRFCIHPEEVYRNVTRVGGTKDASFDRIAVLMPDIIIANKEENTKELIEELEEYFPVWISDVTDFESALEMITALGRIFDREQLSRKLLSDIDLAWSNANFTARKSAAYLIWHSPMMLSGKGTFIDAIMTKAGMKNVSTDQAVRYPELDAEELSALNPELILLSSEPFPFKEKHIAYYQEVCPKAKIVLIDGEMFSWYGSRLIRAGKYIKALIERLGIK